MQLCPASGGAGLRGRLLGEGPEAGADQFDDGAVVGLRDRDVALCCPEDHLTAVLDESRRPDAGDVGVALDALLDDVGYAGVESVEELVEPVQDSPVEFGAGRDRLEPADGVGAFGDGETPVPDASSDVTWFLLEFGVRLLASQPPLLESCARPGGRRAVPAWRGP